MPTDLIPEWLLTALPIAGGVCAGAGLLLLLSVVYWAARDIASRTRDSFARLAAVALVALLPLFGALVYLLIRPRETLAERYEREMLEELLARELSAAALQRKQRRVQSVIAAHDPDAQGATPAQAPTQGYEVGHADDEGEDASGSTLGTSSR